MAYANLFPAFRVGLERLSNNYLTVTHARSMSKGNGHMTFVEGTNWRGMASEESQ